MPSPLPSDILLNRIETLISLYRNSGELTVVEVIGVLEITKLNIFQEILNKLDVDDDNIIEGDLNNSMGYDFDDDFDDD